MFWSFACVKTDGILPCGLSACGEANCYSVKWSSAMGVLEVFAVLLWINDNCGEENFYSVKWSSAMGVLEVFAVLLWINDNCLHSPSDPVALQPLNFDPCFASFSCFQNGPFPGLISSFSPSGSLRITVQCLFFDGFVTPLILHFNL